MKNSTSFKKGHPGYWLGKKRPDFKLTIEGQITLSEKGKKNPPQSYPNWTPPNKGKTLSEEHRKKLSIAHKGKHSKEKCNFWKD